MRFTQLIISLILMILLVWLNQVFGGEAKTVYGGLTWLGWTSMFLVVIGVGLVVMLNDSARGFAFFYRQNVEDSKLKPVRKLTADELKELEIRKYRGPEFPHPVIFTDRCIGCHACVDACPHDVLAIIEGTAAVVAADQCMEDTACQAECPVNPKACIVINTTKEVVSRPSPNRDGANYETNVNGCYIIGDVSGVPLIKNAVKEGAEVIEHIAEELKTTTPEPKAEYDVAIIGIGPGGASAAVTAQEKNLKYIGIEQEKILSTIEMYPKGKYIFFKPDTKDWFGGLPTLGLGLSKSKYGDEENVTDESFETELADKLSKLINEQTSLLKEELLPKIPKSLHKELSPILVEKTTEEFKNGLRKFLKSKGGGENWETLYQTHFLPNKEEVSAEIRAEIANRLETKIPGDQRERILEVWLGEMKEKGVRINEEESCQAIEPAVDGDYFVVKTVRGAEKSEQIYKTRRVVLAIGLRGAPNRLRLPNEDMKFNVNGRKTSKVLYSLTNPKEYKGQHIIVVGGGNSAVEAAVDLVADRNGSDITPRPANQMNKVTLLVRSYFAPTVKFGNKFQVYQCFDEGLLDIRLGVVIDEMSENEVVLADRNGNIIDTIENDYIFALIGGERPDRFLQSIGIEIT